MRTLLGTTHRGFREAARSGKAALFLALARGVGLTISPRQTIWSWPQDVPALSPRLLLFMHFDGAGRVSDPVLFYIRSIAALGFSVIFVTNSGRLTAPATEALQEICSMIFIRRNRGYDFGAWAEVIHRLNLPAPNTKELIIANDSMYGPLRPLDQMLAQLDYSATDIWGLTDSWQERWHLQSFFVAFGEKALRSNAFGAFWRQVRPVPSKSFIIREYEVGLTQKMLKAGLRCQALWPYEHLTARVTDHGTLEVLAQQETLKLIESDPIATRRRLQILRIRDAVARQVALNPTAELWRQLLLSGFPFIKRELLRRNPADVQDVADWMRVVQDELALDPAPVIHQLRVGMKNRAP